MPAQPMFSTLLIDLRRNPRLRLWFALIVGVMCLYVLLLLRDALQSAEQQERAIAQSISRLRAHLAQPEWLQREQAASILVAQLESRLWQAPTAGLAQAALQDWLNSNLKQVQATKPMLTVTVMDEITAGSAPVAPALDPAGLGEAGPPTPPDLGKIRVKLGFDFGAPILLEFLRRLESNDKQIIVSSLIVQKVPLPHVELELLAYFQQQQPKPKL